MRSASASCYSLVILARATKTFVSQLGLFIASILVVVSLVAYVVLISHLRVALQNSSPHLSLDGLLG